MHVRQERCLKRERSVDAELIEHRSVGSAATKRVPRMLLGLGQSEERRSGLAEGECPRGCQALAGLGIPGNPDISRKDSRADRDGTTSSTAAITTTSARAGTAAAGASTAATASSTASSSTSAAACPTATAAAAAATTAAPTPSTITPRPGITQRPRRANRDRQSQNYRYQERPIPHVRALLS